jgi:hypothetical protein
MYPLRGRGRGARWLVVVGCATCSEPVPLSPPPEPASITISPSHGIALNLGGQTSIGVVVRDAAGIPIAVIAGPPLAFTSRNPSVVAVDSTGRVSAVRLGVTYVVASLPTATRVLTDSIFVAVMTTLDRLP